MPSTTSVPRSGNLDIDGILAGVKWASPALTYSFPTLLSQMGYSETGFEAMNATQKTAVRSILDMYAAVSGLTFSEVTESSTVHGTLRFAEENNAGTAYGYYPSTAIQGGDVWLNHTDYNSPVKGTYAYATFIHEIGHTLGLDHGQDGTYALPTDHDSLEYSVMTYRSYVGAPLTGYTVSQGSYPVGLMMDDIAAIQYMYGANYNTNSSNTTYKWSTTTGELSINGVGQGASTTNTIFQTLWDGGGNDTYDFSNYTTNLTIDLNPGGWTSVGGQIAKLGFSGQVARGNIANAYLYNGNTASLIENAIGGTGNDRITGNQANNTLNGGGGNDTLIGGKGNDTIIGGAGTDTCIIAASSIECALSLDTLTQILSVTSLLDGIDTLSGIEYIQFNDKTVATASISLVDTKAPVLVSSTPTDGAGAVNGSANIVLTFSEAVLAGAGNIVIHKSDGSVVATIAAANLLQATIVGTTVTINPPADLAPNASYYVTVDANAFRDIAGNAFAGFSDSTTLNFTTAPSTINGTSAANTLNGTEGSDTINGLGGNDKLNGLGGDDTLNGGAGNDTMAGGTGNDTYVVDNTRDVVTEGVNAGTDLVQSTVTWTLGANVENLTLQGSSAINGTGNGLDNIIIGNGAANTLSGNGGNDVLAGYGGADKLSGGAGNDTLYGGLGKDTLTGNAGADYFVFDTAPASTNIDTISDFTVVDDTIVLDNSIYGVLAEGALAANAFAKGTAAMSADVHLIYNASTGALFYDDDGSDSHAMQQIATLSRNLALTAADFLVI
ncbi:MAG TPA: Ig-like domain-containing protein [Devosia sp.]|nr:Ig-like domain-containing protein [Devosia sp.]